MNALRAEKAKQLEAARRSKLSGRELFQKDNTLDNSDIKFLEDGETPALRAGNQMLNIIDNINHVIM